MVKTTLNDYAMYCSLMGETPEKADRELVALLASIGGDR